MENCRKIFRPLTLLMSSLLIMALWTSCGSDKSADAETLLNTVPQNSDMVAVIYSNQIASAVGSKGENLPENYQKTLDALAGDINKVALKVVLDPNSGCSRDVAVWFATVNDMTSSMTGMLDDPGKFKGYIKKATGGEFEAEGDYERCGSWWLKGNQYWFGENLNPSKMNDWLSLDKQKSFAGNVMAESLSDADHSVNLYVSTRMIFSQLRGANKMMATMALNTIFKDPSYILADMTVEKNETKVEAAVYNNKNEKAEYLMPVAKVKGAELKKMSGSADMFLAIGCNKQLIDKIKDIAESTGLGSSLFPEGLDCIDGTIAIMGNLDARSANQLVITTDGKGTAQLLNTLNSMNLIENLKREGDFILGDSDGATTGVISVDEAAKALNGSILGVCVAPENTDFPKGSIVTVTVSPDGNSVDLKVEVMLNK